MTEEEAHAALDVPRETSRRLSAFAALLREENDRQNLVSRGSLDRLWVRHIYDSAQLLRFAPSDAATWLDFGSGAGFPGLIVAALHPARVTMIESRKLRVDFLRRAAALLGVIDKVEVLCVKAEAVPAAPFDVISARAFAPLDRLLALAARFSTSETVWVLPKGRSAQTELAQARASWQGDFRLEPSLTDADARIIVGRGVKRRAKERSRR
ncbi:MAG: 16S rRNA (guanine(527)-N(7))-methyltransferase RsmG [Alphaproteobacteria bacterium]|nr:16S rRNA (guanine(527)-N(7))-methyltransferase RsmG [Alphaproteobacteria bacterium]